MTSREFDFLKIINNIVNSGYLGDDCAYLDECKLAVSCDSLIEDVHFSRNYMNPFEIAQKALIVNISDILASGAEPKYALVALSGKLDEKFIKEFYSGLKKTADEFGVQIIGGDLTKSEKIMISITILGDYKNRTPSKRSNAKIGYVAAVAGEFGSSAKGLSDLEKGSGENYFTNYHKKPPLFSNISSQIAKTVQKPYAMMDSSDGLADCLHQISKKSNVKIKIQYDKIPKKINDKNLVLYGGEDYSLVVFLDEEDFEKIPGLVKIGSCFKGEGVFLDDKKLEYKGYEHFD